MSHNFDTNSSDEETSLAGSGITALLVDEAPPLSEICFGAPSNLETRTEVSFEEQEEDDLILQIVQQRWQEAARQVAQSAAVSPGSSEAGSLAPEKDVVKPRIAYSKESQPEEGDDAQSTKIASGSGMPIGIQPTKDSNVSDLLNSKVTRLSHPTKESDLPGPHGDVREEEIDIEAAIPLRLRRCAATTFGFDSMPGAYALAPPRQAGLEARDNSPRRPNACERNSVTSRTSLTASNSHHENAAARLAVANAIFAAEDDAETGQTTLPNADHVDLQLESVARIRRKKQALVRAIGCVLGGFILILVLVGGLMKGLSKRGGDSARSGSVSNATPTMSPTSMYAARKSRVLSLLPDFTVAVIPSEGDHEDLALTTAQSRALAWILEDPGLPGYDDERVLQRYAVATFFFGIGGWSFCTREKVDQAASKTFNNVTSGETPRLWNDPEALPYALHECEWLEAQCDSDGNDDPLKIDTDDDLVYYSKNTDNIPNVSCNSNQRLQRIWLEDRGLTGSLPPELALLDSLECLDLTSNHLTGNLPSHLGLLPRLQALHLTNNRGLTGTFPTEIGRMSSLTEFNCVATSLTGTLPTELGLLSSSLQVLMLDNALLTGSIPTKIWSLVGTQCSLS